jgi:hypothetical protein
MRNIGISLLAAAALALPAAAKSPAKAQVTCNDGTTAKAGRGACSRHGGIAREKSSPAGRTEEPARNKTRAELDEGKKETEKKSGGILGTLLGRKKEETAQGRSSTRSTREAKTPRARCKDGTISYSARQSGTCSGHGGVDQWLSK